MSHLELSSKTKNIVKEFFRDYYSKVDVKVPDDFVMREFAFQTFDSESYIRHKSFSSLSLLKEYMISIIPKHSYFSSALYQNPGADSMDEKGWIGSNLIFDIDADEIRGCSPVKVSAYINGEYHDVELINDECLELAKEREVELLDILVNDFGFTYDELEVQFSGNRGFHTMVRPKDAAWLTLSSSARKEIIDYLKGMGLDIRYVIPDIKKKVKLSLPKPSEGGWRRRISKKLTDVSNEDLIEYLKSLIPKCVVEVDEKVTMDLSRLVRVQGSLNGKTGLKVVRLDSRSLHNFKFEEELSPFTDRTAIVLPTADMRKVKLLGYELELTGYMSFRVPASIAIYLALNKLAYIMKVI